MLDPASAGSCARRKRTCLELPSRAALIRAFSALCILNAGADRARLPQKFNRNSSQIESPPKTAGFLRVANPNACSLADAAPARSDRKA
jgi:hypothetical protein